MLAVAPDPSIDLSEAQKQHIDKGQHGDGYQFVHGPAGMTASRKPQPVGRGGAIKTKLLLQAHADCSWEAEKAAG